MGDYETKLQQAISYAKRNPTLLRASIVRRYEVNVTTLSCRIGGTQQTHRAVHEGEQLFTAGEENAIVDYYIMIADCRFLLSHKLLGLIA